MSNNRSVTAARVSTVAMLVCLIVLGVLAPGLAKWYVAFRAMPQKLETVLLICWYTCTVPAAVALLSLLRLLGKIAAGTIFCVPNARRISRVSWCALVCAVICAVGGVFYAPFFLVTAAMLFLFFIVQVVAACFYSAVRMAEENALTV